MTFHLIHSGTKLCQDAFIPSEEKLDLKKKNAFISELQKKQSWERGAMSREVSD